MNRYDFFVEIKNIFKIDSQMIERFDIYKNFLQEQNKIHNLTRLDNDEIIYEQYFFESIIPYINFDFNNKKVLDIGSGSGAPGIILKILFPSMHLTILEANAKKVNFMKQLSKLLGFNDVIFLNQRAEEIKPNQREVFDYVTSRAVAPLKVLLEISTPFLKVNGILIEPKSISYQNEYEQSHNIIKALNLELLEIKETISFKKHYIFIFKKNSTTSNIYPRLWKEIIK